MHDITLRSTCEGDLPKDNITSNKNWKAREKFENKNNNNNINPFAHFARYGQVGFYIQVFRERLSEKVHATTPKGIVGSFECPVLQRNLKELHGRPRTYVCECQRKVKKLVLTATVVRNSVLIISHITFRDCRVHNFSDNLSRNSCMCTPSSVLPRLVREKELR